MRAYLSITRPVNDLVMGFGLIMSFIVAGSLDYNYPILGYVYLFLGGYLVSAHAMVVNDIIDIEIDKINAPQRALPSGAISIKNAKIYATVLFAVGILFFGLIDISGYTEFRWNWLWALIHVILSDLYNFRIKKSGLLGNIIVAYMSWAMFIYADLFINGYFTKIPLFLGMIAFSISLSREVIKGVMDVKGDREHGVLTLAVRYGVKIARNTGIFLQIMVLILAVAILSDTGLIGRIGLGLFIIYFIYTLSVTIKATNYENAYKSKTLGLYAPLLVFPFLVLDQIFML